MKLKYEVLFDPGFVRSLNKLTKVDLDMKDAICLAKTIKTLTEEGKIAFPIRDDLFERFGIDKSKPNYDSLNEEARSEFDQKVTELLETEFEIQLKKKIVLSSSIKGKISVDDLMTLDKIVEY